MGTQQLPLCWNSHQTEILATFQRLLVEESLVDVTLACEGISLKAHKTILSACSPFFQDLFLENPCKHPIVIMKDVKYRDLKGIVDFMYHGGINVAPDQLSEFLKTAEALKVKGLSEHSNTTILDLNKRLRAQEKTPQKIADFQQSLSPCLQGKDFVETPSIREENAHCEQITVSDFIAISEKDACTMEDETSTFNVKSEPEPNDDICCEEVLPEHTLSDDSLLSVHYDERFVPEMEIAEGDQNLVLVPRCQQEILTSETLPQSSDASSHDAVLPLGHISSAESLGVVISPDVADNSESVMHYSPFEHSSVTLHASSNQDVKPITLMSYEEPSACSTSDQMHQRYNSVDLSGKRIADVSEQRGFISSEQEANQTEWANISIEEIDIEQNPSDVFSHPSSFSSGISTRGKRNVNYSRNIESGSQISSSRNSAESGGLIRKSYVQKCEKVRWPLEAIKKAIQAIHNGMTIRQSASLFHIPRSTLFDRLKRSKKSDNANSYPALEKEVLKYIKSKCPSGLNLIQLQELAFSLATKNKIPHPFSKQNQRLGKEWLSHLISCHPIIKLKLRIHDVTNVSSRINPERACKLGRPRKNVKSRRYVKKPK